MRNMKIKILEYGTMCEVRLKDRRIRVYRLHDKSWSVAFVRPSKPCSGCPENHDCVHELYKDKKNRIVMTGLGLSGMAMVGVMNAVMTLIELERSGVEVKE